MIEIQEPPTIDACTTTMEALQWVWVPRDQQWRAVSAVPGQPDMWKVHRCRRHGKPGPSWRDLRRQDPKTIHAGAARVRRVLQERIEEKEITPDV